MIVSISGVHLDGSNGPANQTRQPLSIGRGESATINLAVVGQDASPIDLTGWGVQARVERVDGTTLVQRIGTLVSAAGGTAQIKLLSAETATWAVQKAAWSIWITDPADESYPVMLRSDFNVESRVMDVDGLGSTPGPDMILVGVPVPQAGDEGKSLKVVTVSPLVLAWL